MDLSLSPESPSRAIISLEDSQERRAIVHDTMPILSITRMRLLLSEPDTYPYEVEVRRRLLNPMLKRLGFLVRNVQPGGVGFGREYYERLGQTIFEYLDNDSSEPSS